MYINATGKTMTAYPSQNVFTVVDLLILSVWMEGSYHEGYAQYCTGVEQISRALYHFVNIYHFSYSFVAYNKIL